MNFGERLKELRRNRDWSQPELADAIGIEQSYLSKLENDKSAPSPDMLERILEAFDIDIETLLNGVDESKIQNQLRSIPRVNGHFQAAKEAVRGASRRWFLGSAITCVLGIMIFAVGFSSLLRPPVIFDYTSNEIIPNGSNGESFESLESFLQSEFSPVYDELVARGLGGLELEGESIVEFEKLRYQYSSLNSDQFHFSSVYEGQNFIDEVTDEQDLVNLQATGLTNGGSRVFELYNTRDDRAMDSTTVGVWIAGVFLFGLGFFGFLLERRYYRET